MSKAARKTGADPGKVAAPYDAADYLRSPEEIAAYLEAVFEDYGDDARVVAKALGDVARARGMQRIARETGLNREGLYKALSGAGNPSFDTILKVMRAVGVELRPKSMPRKSSPGKGKGRRATAKVRPAPFIGRRPETDEFGGRGAQGRKRA
jgi:probable addiction module antidote protein